VDTGKVEVLRAALDGVHDDFDVRLAELAVRKVGKRGDIDVASKELANLLLARERAVLCAPVDGIVVSEQINVGDVLQAGKPVVEIAQQDGFRFEAVVPGSDVGDLEVGMPVKIKFDAYDYQKYGTLDGTVCFISPDSRIAQSETSAASTAEPLSFTVRIDLHDRELGRGPLRGVVKLGLGGTAEVVTGRESILAIFLKKIRRTISLT
jgi:HlyD family secretion protein